MVTRDNLRKLAHTRLKDAKALYAAGQYDGAMYVAGYVVENALKARICSHLLMQEYPGDNGDKYKSIFGVHDFDLLAQLGGLTHHINLAANPMLVANWSIVKQWGPEHRYRPVGSATKGDVEQLLAAIEDAPEGVFTWIKRRW